MRSLVGHFVVPLLATLLVLTTPVGTGQGVHQNELLHPAFAHVHLIDGRIVSDDQLRMVQATAQGDSVTQQATSGPALGAGSGADAGGLGIALGPTLPAVGLPFTGLAPAWVRLPKNAMPAEYRDPPQEPPPDHFV